MRWMIATSLTLLSLPLLAGGPERESVETLIKKLGSASAAARQEATEALKKRPDAAAALREARRSSDPEVARRASDILDYFAAAPLRDLYAAAKGGKIDFVIDSLNKWPKETFREQAWPALREFSRALVNLHKEKGGKKIELFRVLGEGAPLLITSERITQDTEVVLDRPCLLRAGTVDLDFQKLKPGARKNQFRDGNLIVLSGSSVRVRGEGVEWDSEVIFARGSVELDGSIGGTALIVSGGDVRLHSPLGNSLVIARGKVVCTGRVEGSRIISGGWVITQRDPRDSIITENESKPLGFIRWGVAPAQDKATREIQSAATEGQVLKFVESASSHPTGKHDEEAWYAFRHLAFTVADLHAKKGGEKIELGEFLGGVKVPPVFSAKQITVATKCQDDRLYFLRAGSVDLDHAKRKPGEVRQNYLEHSPAIVASGGVCFSPWRSHVIFAGGPVELKESDLPISDTIIISGGDVMLRCDLSNSVVIAQGRVKSTGSIERGRIISGMSVTTEKKITRDCIITENESNPLGFIRWADSPKEKKAPAKAK